MKRCGACKTEMPESEFWRNNAKRDGLSATCKECQRVQARKNSKSPHGVKARRAKQKRQYHTGTLKARQRVKAKKLRATPKARARERRHSKVYAARYPEKRHAHKLVNAAVKAGKLSRPKDCPRCGAIEPKYQNGRSAIHGHHHKGYDLPLDVIWLCISCHAAEHNKEKING